MPLVCALLKKFHAPNKRQKFRRMALARVRARAIVLAEGEQKKAREMARALKTMDVPIEKIVAASGLTQAEVEAL